MFARKHLHVDLLPEYQGAGLRPAPDAATGGRLARSSETDGSIRYDHCTRETAMCTASVASQRAKPRLNSVLDRARANLGAPILTATWW